MAQGVKQRMVEGAVVLLAKHGLQATSFSGVLALTGAPRGSVYHYFPEGKEQLVASAVDLAGERAITLLDELEGASADEITRRFLAMWRSLLERSGFGAGCAVLAVTVAADSPALLEHATVVFRTWRGRLALLLETGGLAPADAAGFASLLVAASEGAVVLARAEQSMEPFDLVADQLLNSLKALPGIH
ncbi:TetR/AcrR family transcriptional regulator [Diaminobutyricibacter sp. McL0618]|uniref:TetR/AcrR family transcriptional regulator n=1 Tax=Leifsonia sp. McL0618 TaxID=3415677 RepID=UPI003CEDD696